MEEEGCPAHYEDPQQDGERDGGLHVSPLVDGVVSGQGGNALDVRASQHEHVRVERGHEHQHDEEHGHQAHDDERAVRVDDKDDATSSAKGPNPGDYERSTLHCHDVVVAQRVKCGDVAVYSNGQEAAHGCHYRDADHGVKDIVYLPDDVILRHQLLIAEQVDDDGLPGVRHAHQHVRHRQTAHEEVHGRVQVLVLHYGADDQDVLQQAYDAQGEEDLGSDIELLANFGFGPSGRSLTGV